MAGRYVVLEFEDKEEAQAFLDDFKEDRRWTTGRIIAMFLKPKAFCECPDKSRQQLNNWRKNKKYGLYICGRCKKPSRFHNRGVLERLQYPFGYNMLDTEEKE